ncbi:MAG: RidA family protein [Acetobacteraceae bacterium]|nr:RidA family protein [Acetobacteraceae bacterium]
MAGLIDQKLTALGLSLPTPAAPIANYVGYVVTPGFVTLSGQLPVVDGTVAIVGTLGDTLTVEEGQRAARICFLNVLAQLKAACAGDLDRVTRIVHLRGFVASTPSFAQHALVMNGASDLAVAVFGEAGRHARSTVGVVSLPAGAAVEVEAVAQIA